MDRTRCSADPILPFASNVVPLGHWIYDCMDARNQNDWALGFLSVRHHPSCGYFGGFLVVNPLARPMEFHCTLPLQPTRAQQILYGATLEEFICGEQIGRVLVQRAKGTPKAILCDSQASLSLRHVERVPIASIELGKLRSISESSPLRTPHVARDALESFPFADYTLKVLAEHQNDRSALETFLDQLPDHFDLLEPFSRIEEALMEANPVARAA